ncbi:MAG: hypothetical protein HC896_13895 [Bacteroidales bacterium]|nr:hypothetical protein [Bacteroidales bacterium]
MKIIQQKPEGFHVISGDDALTFPMIALGAVGTISVVANLATKDFANMVREALAGNVNTAAELHYKQLNLINLLFEEGSPTGIKAALHAYGLAKNILRLPLIPASSDLFERIKKEVGTVIR